MRCGIEGWCLGFALWVGRIFVWGLAEALGWCLGYWVAEWLGRCGTCVSLIVLTWLMGGLLVYGAVLGCFSFHFPVWYTKIRDSNSLLPPFGVFPESWKCHDVPAEES